MYYTYPWYQWLMFFYIYCFFGWIFESAYVSLKKRKFVNRGFLRLPMLPLYGTGAVMMLWVSLPVKDNLFLVYISGVIAATLLEYVTGYVMERLFKMKYWDYSNQKFQLHGYICLGTSLTWGFLTLFLTEIIHEPIAKWVLSWPLALEAILLIAITIIFAMDVVQSVKNALDLGRALESITQLQQELEEMQLQLALLRGEVRSFVEDFKEDPAQMLDDLKDDTTQRLEELKEDTSQKIEEFKDSLSQRLEERRDEELARRIHTIRERRQALLQRNSPLLERLLTGNPSASSKRFKEALKELKEVIEARHENL